MEVYNIFQKYEQYKTKRNKWDYVDRVLLLLIFFEKLNQWIKVPVGSKTDEIKVIPSNPCIKCSDETTPTLLEFSSTTPVVPVVYTN